MKQAPFEHAHRDEWEAFERFLDAQGVQFQRGRGFSLWRRAARATGLPFDPAELPQRYRRLCQQLALAADRLYSPDLVDRLNHLALRGHHVLYANRGPQSQRALEFFLSAFPALVRKEWRLVTAAALLFFGPLLLLLAVLQVFPEFVHYLLSPHQIADFHNMYNPANRRLGMPEADSQFEMFGVYIWNNVRIGFQTFAGGILAGVGSVWFLAANGVIIGAVAGYLTQAGYTETFWSFVAGHSSLELIAIVLSGAAGLRLGAAVVAPGKASRRAALVASARPAVRMMYGAAAMFMLAAFVEAFWSPLRDIPFSVKIGVGLAGWAGVLGYLCLAGRARATG